MPTAGIVPKGMYSVDANVFDPGGALVDFNAGILKNFSIGVGFSGSGIIGSTAMKFQEMPGFSLKFRILDEEKNIPAIAVGFSSQGNGKFYKSSKIRLDSATGKEVEFGKRFQAMSPGFYVAASKSFKWAVGQLFAHAGVNYSVEPNSDNNSINFYLGGEQTIGTRIALNAEYNFNLDENDYDYIDYKGNHFQYMKHLGTLNTAFRYSLSKGVTLSIEFHDMLRHRNKAFTPNNGGQIERRLNLQMVRSF